MQCFLLPLFFFFFPFRFLCLIDWAIDEADDIFVHSFVWQSLFTPCMLWVALNKKKGWETLESHLVSPKN